MALPLLLSTGIDGLDQILGGGLPKNRVYLVQGEPGTGKTTLGLQFLLKGASEGEQGLYVTLSETKDELSAVAESHGWSLDSISVFEVKGSEEHLAPEDEYTAFHPAEVELGQTVQTLLHEVDQVKPARVVIDSLSEMRLLARDPLRYRRQILALKQFFVERGCTVLFLDDPETKIGEHQFQTLAHGVISFERFPPEYGRARRRMQVVKMRGVEFHDGYHDCTIVQGGQLIYPRLVARGESNGLAKERVSSGVAEIDTLLGGGPHRGTSTLILGAAGVGKTTLSLQYAVAAAARGEQVAVFSFDERSETMFIRADGMNLPLRRYVEEGVITVEQIEPAVLSPGAFIARVRHAVEKLGARMVVIDSLNGYLLSMPGEQYLVVQMHELLTYLSEYGVFSVVVVPQHGLLGSTFESPVDLSYLADTVLLLRYFEHAGRVRKAISVVKTRGGLHEDSIREYQLGVRGVTVGEPLKEFHGILSGTPAYVGTSNPLLESGGSN